MLFLSRLLILLFGCHEEAVISAKSLYSSLTMRRTELFTYGIAWNSWVLSRVTFFF